MNIKYKYKQIKTNVLEVITEKVHEKMMNYWIKYWIELIKLEFDESNYKDIKKSKYFYDSRLKSL